MDNEALYNMSQNVLREIIRKSHPGDIARLKDDALHASNKGDVEKADMIKSIIGIANIYREEGYFPALDETREYLGNSESPDDLSTSIILTLFRYMFV